MLQELGYNDKYYRKMLQAIQDGGPTKGRVGRTQVDRDTRKLLDQACTSSSWSSAGQAVLLADLLYP